MNIVGDESKVRELLRVLSNVTNEIERSKASILEKTENYFEFVIKNIFDSIPKLKSISWKQEFSVSDDGISVFEIKNFSFLSFLAEDYSESYNLKDYDQEESGFIYSVNESFVNINEHNLSSIEKEMMGVFYYLVSKNSDVFLNFYGNNVEIIISKGNEIVTKYDN